VLLPSNTHRKPICQLQLFCFHLWPVYWLSLVAQRRTGGAPCSLLMAHVGFEVLTAVVMHSTIFWHITPCSSETVRRFGQSYCVNFKGRKLSQARNQQMMKNKLLRNVGISLNYKALEPRRAYCSTMNEDHASLRTSRAARYTFVGAKVFRTKSQTKLQRECRVPDVLQHELRMQRSCATGCVSMSDCLCSPNYF
jgi:hypothetical protein